MLDIEQPDPADQADQQCQRLNDEIGFQPHDQAKRGPDCYDDQVGAIDTDYLPSIRLTLGDPVGNERNKERSQKKHYQRMAEQPVLEAQLERGTVILGDCHGPDISKAALIEIARRFVMLGVIYAPVVVGCKCYHSCDSPPEVVGFARPEK